MHGIAHSAEWLPTAWKAEVRIPRRVGFSSPPDSYSMGIEIPCLEGQSSRSVKLKTHLQTVPRLKIHGALLPLTPTTSEGGAQASNTLSLLHHLQFPLVSGRSQKEALRRRCAQQISHELINNELMKGVKCNIHKSALWRCAGQKQ
jgi:hypothetical protein